MSTQHVYVEHIGGTSRIDQHLTKVDYSGLKSTTMTFMADNLFVSFINKHQIIATPYEFLRLIS